jgi:hypothetical protein
VECTSKNFKLYKHKLICYNETYGGLLRRKWLPIGYRWKISMLV